MDKPLKIKYIVCFALAALLSVIAFSLFFLFGSNGLLGIALVEEPDVRSTTVSNVITQRDEKAVLTETIKKYEEYLASPYMISVTKEQPLPENYSVQLTPLSEFPDIMLESEAAARLDEFIAQARALNITLVVFSGYRTGEMQQELYDKMKQSVRAAGFTDENIIEQKTMLATALPGHSEHQTGLAADIGQTTSDVASEAVLTEFYRFAVQNIHKYGFILSYPENSYTGYDFMPWHFRYIGDPEQAKYIMEKGISLKDYIDYLQTQIETDRARLEELENEQ